jgi:hypothetical protein
MQGFGWLSEDDFVNHFAADVDPVMAKVMYQQPLAAAVFGDVMGVPAWKTQKGIQPLERRRRAASAAADILLIAR